MKQIWLTFGDQIVALNYPASLRREVEAIFTKRTAPKGRPSLPSASRRTSLAGSPSKPKARQRLLTWRRMTASSALLERPWNAHHRAQFGCRSALGRCRLEAEGDTSAGEDRLRKELSQCLAG